MLAQPTILLFQFLSLLACMAAGANLENTWWLVGLHLWLEPPIDVYERIAEELEGMPQYIARRRWMEEASSYAMGVGPLSRLSSGRMRGWVCRVWIDGYWHAQIPWLPVFGGARMRAFRRQLEAASAAMSAAARPLQLTTSSLRTRTSSRRSSLEQRRHQQMLLLQWWKRGQ